MKKNHYRNAWIFLSFGANDSLSLKKTYSGRIEEGGQEEL